MKKKPIDTFYSYIDAIFGRNIALGITLLVMVCIALIWANSPWKESYHHLWEMEFTIGFQEYGLTESLHHWINDFLMAYFFFLVGLEIKKELTDGRLASFKKASVPVFGALGGMAIPALIYLLINWNGEGMNGWGIPMATDIAFAIGLLALAGSAVTKSSKTFLTTLATVDDIGAILVIAFFLTANIDMGNLLAAGIYFIIMIIGNLLGIRSVWFYFLVGVLGLWLALLLSGVHATLAGVLAAFCIPARTKLKEETFLKNLELRTGKFEASKFTPSKLLTEDQVEIIQEIIQDSKRALTPLQRIENNLRPFVNYFVLPLFALANAGITIEEGFGEMLLHPVSLGVIAGLVLGKLGGIVLAIYLTTKSGIGKLGDDLNWKNISGLSLMAGIGFTMSIFIAGLALEDPYLLTTAKVGVLVGSAISAVVGITWLRFSNRKN